MAWDQSVKSPRRSRTPINPVWFIYTSAVWFEVLLACLQLVHVSTVFCCIYLEEAWDQSVQSPGMPRATKNSAHVTNTSVSQEYSSSEQEMEVQNQRFQPSTSQAQFVPPMFMPYIEGSKMDWAVNDGLYHRFLEVEAEIWEYSWLWTCNVTWVKEVLESHSLE